MNAASRQRRGEQGYLLLGLVVTCFLLLLVLGVAAPRVAKELERDREVESEHRAQEYVRAIQLYYRRNGSYPGSVEQLLGGAGTGMSSAQNVKYLRQQYKDPLTHDEFRLIHLGEAKTEVKGFFGEPLQGLPTGNIGSNTASQFGFGGSGSNAAGAISAGLGSGLASGSNTNSSLTSGGTAGGGSSFSSGSFSLGSGTQAGGAAGSPTAGTGSSTGSTTGGSTGSAGAGSAGSTFMSGNSASSFQGSKGAIVGVGSNAKGHGLVEWNGSENIEDWEYLYDPRVEQMKAKVSILGGSPAAGGSSGMGMSGSMGTSTGSSFGSSAGSGTATGTGTFGSGAGSSLGFGTSSSGSGGSSGFGSSGSFGSGFGSSGSSGSGTSSSGSNADGTGTSTTKL